MFTTKWRTDTHKVCDCGETISESGYSYFSTITNTYYTVMPRSTYIARFESSYSGLGNISSSTVQQRCLWEGYHGIKS